MPQESAYTGSTTYCPAVSEAELEEFINAIKRGYDPNSYFRMRAAQSARYAAALLRANGLAVTWRAIVAIADDPALAAVLRKSTSTPVDVPIGIYSHEPPEMRRTAVAIIDEWFSGKERFACSAGYDPRQQLGAS